MKAKLQIKKTVRFDIKATNQNSIKSELTGLDKSNFQ